MSSTIVFFDGVCGLCNGFVDFVMKHDKNGTFLFSPLQSDFARGRLPQEYTADLKSVVVEIDGQVFVKSQAVFKVLERLGKGWRLLSRFSFLPEGPLNWGYDLVAGNRYRIFGKKESCRLPTPEERARFIL